MGTKKYPPWFKMHDSIAPAVKYLPKEIAGEGFQAAMMYYTEGVEPDFSNLEPAAISIYAMLKDWIDEASEDTRKKSEDGREYARRRWDRYKEMGTHAEPIGTHADKEPDKEPEEERDSEEEYRNNDYARSYPTDTSMQPPSKLFIKMPLKDGNTFGISEADVVAYAKRYPGVEVEQAFRSMTGWLLSNPSKQKTRQAMGKFITHWLDQAQDNTHNVPSSNPFSIRPSESGNPFSDVPDFADDN